MPQHNFPPKPNNAAQLVDQNFINLHEMTFSYRFDVLTKDFKSLEENKVAPADVINATKSRWWVLYILAHQCMALKLHTCSFFWFWNL